ncbi:hypothetical protein GCM10010909_07820 [Acidocella aquatica]|uniref:Thioesterase domain-containing protein n=1 Tax=Acidocella aquatica TaxID=1922313 RepID=A0ABQ6A7K6_9PROT|nr:thioesterase family protein [Acidocella aquatica]GLR66104.1 hypothetical protein GCM10010909_07820 [Acidocella aquatica]
MGELLGRPLHKHLDALGLGTPMRAMSFEFHQSLWPDRVFFMEVHVAAVRVRGFDLIVTGKDDEGHRYFTAMLSPVCISAGVRRAVPVPDVLRRKLEEYQLREPVPVSS